MCEERYLEEKDSAFCLGGVKMTKTGTKHRASDELTIDCQHSGLHFFSEPPLKTTF